MSFTKLYYCQYLLSRQINYTLTNMAEHLKSWSPDTINRYLKGEKLTPRLLFEQVEPWRIASHSRSSKTRNYIGAITRISDIEQGNGEFNTKEAFYSYWRNYEWQGVVRAPSR